MRIKRNNLPEIGKRLYFLRDQWKLTRGQMAKRIGMTANAYGKNENGVTIPCLKTLEVLSREYKISMDWLLFGVGSQYRAQEPVYPQTPGQATL